MISLSNIISKNQNERIIHTQVFRSILVICFFHLYYNCINICSVCFARKNNVYCIANNRFFTSNDKRQSISGYLVGYFPSYNIWIFHIFYTHLFFHNFICYAKTENIHHTCLLSNNCLLLVSDISCIRSTIRTLCLSHIVCSDTFHVHTCRTTQNCKRSGRC